MPKLRAVTKALAAVAIAAALLAALPAAAADAPGFDALVAAYETPVFGQFVRFDPQTLKAGHATFTMTAGSAAPVMLGDEVIGFFFQGAGSIQYESAEPIEHPVVRFNAERGGKMTVSEKGTSLLLTRGFDQVLWLSANVPLPSVAGPPALAQVDAAAHLATFGRARMTPRSHVFVMPRLNGAKGMLVRAEISSGGRNPLVYQYDAADGMSEWLTALVESSFDDREMQKHLYAHPLSEQPVGRGLRDAAKPRFTLTRVEYTLDASAGKYATLAMAETLVPHGAARRAFDFDLLDTMYNWGGVQLTTRHLRLEKVTDAAGRSVPFHHARDRLLVTLAEAVAPETPVVLRFAIAGDILIRPGGDNFWQLGVAPWFPQPPSLGEQAYTVRSTVRVPKPFVPFAPGRTLSRRLEGEINVLESELVEPVQFTIVHAGKYAFAEKTKGGLTVRVASYGMRNKPALDNLTNLAHDIVELFEFFLGPFPFPELDIIEIDDYGWGQAPPGTMFITQEAFSPTMGLLNEYFSQGINERFAHEIAHQYWGHVVKMGSLEEQWLTESFAEYSAALFILKARGKGDYRMLLDNWKQGASKATKIAPIPLANRISAPADPQLQFAARTRLLYLKGPWLLARLHAELGDGPFLTFLKSYQKSFRFKFGTTKDVEGLLKAVTKKDYGPFFAANFWGLGMPEN